jgi:hypothetical protein
MIGETAVLHHAAETVTRVGARGPHGGATRDNGSNSNRRNSSTCCTRDNSDNIIILPNGAVTIVPKTPYALRDPFTLAATSDDLGWFLGQTEGVTPLLRGQWFRPEPYEGL